MHFSRRFKLLGSVLPVLAALLVVGGCSGKRDHILRVYNWSDYMDLSAIEEFEKWYEEQTGETVKVDYQTFDFNEHMLTRIERAHEDFDVVCPSDYVIERMLTRNLLLPISRDFGDTPDYTVTISPYIRARFDKIEGGGKNANDYAVGSMWGTTGIIYNAQYVTDEEASSWDILRNPKFADKIFIKDSALDVFSQIILYLRQDDLRSGKVTLDELMHDSSDEALAEVEAFLRDVQPLVAGWEADFGKDQMVQERGWISLNWSGEGVWTAEQAAPLGIDLRFSRPKEGYTVWFDGWVIPKYARNTKAARYWINYMSRPDIAIRNMRETGYASANGCPQVLQAIIDERYEPIDLSYFFGPNAKAVRVNPTLMPDCESICMAATEHDWGDRSRALEAMFRRVKGVGTNMVTAIVIGVLLVLLLGVAYYRRFHGKKPEEEERS